MSLHEGSVEERSVSLPKSSWAVLDSVAEKLNLSTDEMVERLVHKFAESSLRDGPQQREAKTVKNKEEGIQTLDVHLNILNIIHGDVNVAGDCAIGGNVTTTFDDGMIWKRLKRYIKTFSRLLEQSKRQGLSASTRSAAGGVGDRLGQASVEAKITGTVSAVKP